MNKKRVRSILSNLLFNYLTWILLMSLISVNAQKSSFSSMVDDLISKDVPIIKVEELQNKTNITFLDTRSSEEYELSHIKNALWVGEKNWDMEAIKNIDSKQILVVYCSVGYRSEKLVKKILHLKSHKTFNLYGGIFDWINKGKSIENRSGITDSIHGFNQNFARWIKKGIPVY